MAMDDEIMENQIVGVDDIFESFIKEKLKQLGKQRAASKSIDLGAMNELEMNIKLRLEQNLTQNNETSHGGERLEETLSDEPILQSQQVTEPVAKRQKQEDISGPQNNKSKSSKKEKKHKKKKKKKEKNDKEAFFGPSEVQNSKSKDKVLNNLKKEKKDPVEIKPDNHLNTEKSGDVKKESTSSNTVIDDARRNSSPIQSESNVMSTSKLKKDISVIKMKVELLKVKNAEAKLNKELEGALCENHQKQIATADNADREKNELKVNSTRETGRKRSREKRSSSCSRKHSKSHSRHRTRSHSSSPDRKHRRHHRDHSKSPSKHRRHRRSRSHDRHSKKTRRRSRSPRISAEDKLKLLEIAKANVLAQHRANITANSVTSIGQIVREGSMSVSELTDICRDISSNNVEEQEPMTKEKAEDMLKEVETSSVHHPFSVKELPISIKPVKTLPVAPPVVSKPIETLSKEFPVSCGQQHRRKEVLENVYGKWEAVAKDESTKKAVKELVKSEKVFVEAEPTNVDLNSVIAARLSAARELQDNPDNATAKNKMQAAQEALNNWTKSRKVIGQFTGHTGLTAMPKAVLEGGIPAWFNADTLKNAKPVVGIGKSLLQKMGWKPGMPLGKSMPGQIEPLSVDFKTDRRGLSSYMEAAPVASKKSKKQVIANQVTKDMSNKHPVSALTEICSKKHWPPPEFRLVDPLNLTLFAFRVSVCNDEYEGKPASNKKEAKKNAAVIALQTMGLLPKT